MPVYRYGVGSGVFTATAIDTLAGLFSLAFPDTTDYGATYSTLAWGNTSWP